ncbi:hypothetical protein Drorol1_Dr00014168 [Drosera rotundifolia]
MVNWFNPRFVVLQSNAPRGPYHCSVSNYSTIYQRRFRHSAFILSCFYRYSALRVDFSLYPHQHCNTLPITAFHHISALPFHKSPKPFCQINPKVQALALPVSPQDNFSVNSIDNMLGQLGLTWVGFDLIGRFVLGKIGMEETRAGDGSELKVHVFLDSNELIEKLHQRWDSVKDHPYRAMYSSTFGGIIFDPALMVIPIDDHMVHRGHGVFDTAIVFDGFLYELDEHLDRFLKSAAVAKISSPYPRSALRSILIQLAAASKCKKGTLRYWLSAGPGNFLLSPSGCSSAFYAIVINENFSQCREGVSVITSSIPMKSPVFATMKNVNYLPNVLAQMEAEEKGAFASIWVDDEGYVAEGPNVNVAFVTHDKELILPAFDKILSGCTAKRLLTLAIKLVELGMLSGVKTMNLRLEEAKASAEMMFVGSTLPIVPIIKWDEEPIGDGIVGELTLLLSDLLWNDMASGVGAQRVR